MKVKDISGYEYDWKYSKKKGPGRKSNLSLKILDIIVENTGNSSVIQEAKIYIKQRRNGQRAKILYLDFYIPNFNLAIEVHGQQHYEYNSHFHKTNRDFFQQRRNDEDKTLWCELNSINLLVLKYDECNIWRDQIRSKITGLTK